MNVFTSSSWLDQLDAIVAAGLIYEIRLFQNNHIPLLTDTIADYTEATFSGYTGFVALAWGSAFVNGSTQGEIDAPPASWTHNGGGVVNTVYGVYVLDNSGNLAYADRFSAPIVMSSAGDNITYTPRVTLFNQ